MQKLFKRTVAKRRIDKLAEKYEIKVEKYKNKALIGDGMIRDKRVLLVKPQTFMNLSGNAVRYWLQKENIPVENLLIVVDDLALPFGTLRLKPKGSDAGHNGLKNIAQLLNTQGSSLALRSVSTSMKSAGTPCASQCCLIISRLPGIKGHCIS